MEVIYSSMRWPAALYRAIKHEAARQGISVNELVRNTMAQALHVADERDTEARR